MNKALQKSKELSSAEALAKVGRKAAMKNPIEALRYE